MVLQIPESICLAQWALNVLDQLLVFGAEAGDGTASLGVIGRQPQLYIGHDLHLEGPQKQAPGIGKDILMANTHQQGNGLVKAP